MAENHIDKAQSHNNTKLLPHRSLDQSVSLANRDDEAPSRGMIQKSNIEDQLIRHAKTMASALNMTKQINDDQKLY